MFKYFNDFNYLSNFCYSNNVVRLSVRNKNHKSELIGIFDKTTLTIGNHNIYILPPPGGFFQATQLAEKVILELTVKHVIFWSYTKNH